MEDLLYLVHRIPYPPNKGDKIRSFHLLKHLSKQHRVHVGAFVDDKADWAYAEVVKKLAGGEVCLLPLHSKWATLKSATGLLTGEPLTLPYYRNRRLQSWVDALLARGNIRRALVYSSSMAQYLMPPHFISGGDLNRVIDFVDIDSDKWRQYAEKKSWATSWVYRREAAQLLSYEHQVTQAFDAATFVSDAEAALFKRLVPEGAHKVFGFSNGVDTEYFSPAHGLANPYLPEERAIVFTGAMDYWANVDAVTWFASEVFRAVRDKMPNARFYIVGARPTPDVQSLGTIPGVVVTGSVPDVRPYLAHAALAVAPLRIARGIQNKVLEAMAMARPTIVSPEALEGIDAEPGQELLLARNGEDFRHQCLALLQGEPATVGEMIGERARVRVMADYSWDHHLAGLDRALDHRAAPASADVRASLKEYHA
jgi:sugar transferase (PEP-CTERM/EpsH1 system associated)